MTDPRGDSALAEPHGDQQRVLVSCVRQEPIPPGKFCPASPIAEFSQEKFPGVRVSEGREFRHRGGFGNGPNPSASGAALLAFAPGMNASPPAGRRGGGRLNRRGRFVRPPTRERMHWRRGRVDVEAFFVDLFVAVARKGHFRVGNRLANLPRHCTK